MSIFDELERLLKEQTEKGKVLSRFIVLIWIVSLGIDFIAYMMAMNSSTYGMRGQVRSYLTAYTQILLIYAIGFIAGFILSVLIFYSIAKYSRRDAIYLAGGFFFLLSGFFDFFAAYQTLNVRNRLLETLMRLPLFTIDALQNFVTKQLYGFIELINNLALWSTVLIGGAFVAFGLSNIKFTRFLGEQKSQIIMALMSMAPGRESSNSSYYLINVIGRELDSAISRIKLSGIIYLIVGFIELAAFIPAVQDFLFFAFLLFLIGAGLESSGYKKLQSVIEAWRKGGIVIP